MQSFTSVPFKTESAHGFKTANGIAKFSSAGLVLEFEAKLFGLIGSGVKEVKIRKEEILDIKFRKGLFKYGAKIEIRTKTFAKITELPSSDGKLSLKLDRDDFERGRAAVVQLQKEMQEHTAALPPTETRVSQLFADESEDETQLLDKEQI